MPNVARRGLCCCFRGRGEDQSLLLTVKGAPSSLLESYLKLSLFYLLKRNGDDQELFSLLLSTKRQTELAFFGRGVGRGSLLLWDAAVEDLPGDLFPYPYRAKKPFSCRWRGRGALFSLVRLFWDWRSFVSFWLGASSPHFSSEVMET